MLTSLLAGGSARLGGLPWLAEVSDGMWKFEFNDVGSVWPPCLGSSMHS